MILPPATLGMLGGGQLGRFFVAAAHEMGYKVWVLDPDPHSPAGLIADRHLQAGYDDFAALDALADGCAAVTTEFENVPATTLDYLAKFIPVRPGASAVAVCQNRIAEKSFLRDNGIPHGPFAVIHSDADIAAADAGLYPAILKVARFGYDGKGQAKIASPDDVGPAFAAMKGAPAILEGWVPFSREISVLTARGVDGTIVTFDVPENEHRHHILKFSRIPARLAPATEAEARRIGETVAAALDHVGVLAVELFVVETAEGERLVANEMAPRVHNSGHWTESACLVSQFEAHMRAVAGLPLSPPTRHSDVEMENLIGDDALAPERYLAEPGASLHLYGKAEIRAGRKMGHVNRIRPRKPGA